MNIENLLKCLRSYLVNASKPSSPQNAMYSGLCLYYTMMDGCYDTDAYAEIQELRNAMADAFICGPWMHPDSSYLADPGPTPGRIAFVEAAIKFLESKQ